ncbi:MAG: DNA repair protein RadC [Holosporaceae bacterium]|jgi:DNA repair protein RadC|nr:DNA repair protein RadC [Holosporaceae bacterium]
MKNIDKIEYIKCLNNQELLNLLFSNKIRSSDLRKLTKSFTTLRELFFADSDRIKAVEKVDHRGISALTCLREILERASREKLTRRISIKSLGNVLDYCKITMSALSREQLRILFLNSANMLLFEDVEDHGCVNGIAIYARNLIKRALNLEASAIILVHNHPSRSTNPSIADIALTRRLAHAAKELDIKLLDHIIIGGNNHFSMLEHGMM